jgi:hypothetical protein
MTRHADFGGDSMTVTHKPQPYPITLCSSARLPTTTPIPETLSLDSVLGGILTRADRSASYAPLYPAVT